ncbi:MAG TPA: hypothetical protein VLE44_00660 [Candidatus Saccharimonadales bacterium]|nr:hypothetical protein [Candidatus Saccharimonadales bacterium]
MQIHYSSGNKLNWKRAKKGTGFTFINQNGKSVSNKASLNRITKLVIPPAWKEVMVSSDPKDYIQAIGVDAKGRKQYIYHPLWVKRNQERKFDQMISFGERLPSLRAAVKAHMREHELTRDRVIATVVWLLENTFIRIGNKTYAEENGSYGLTTIREKHVAMRGNKVKFSFKGKSGVFHEIDVTQPTVVKTIRECIELPGYELFQYIDENDNKKVVDSGDVNDYLQEHTGADFSAKDFRTWGGSVLAGDSLYKKGNAPSENDLKNNISEVVTEVSEHLGNTKKVCRTYYIHPTIITSYEKDILVPHFERSYSRKLHKKLSLTPEEYATWSLIKDS